MRKASLAARRGRQDARTGFGRASMARFPRWGAKASVRPPYEGSGRRRVSRPAGGDSTMTTETAIIVGAITAAFIGFALTLWWAERQTRDIKGE
jgi:hypothetical protein